MTSSSRKQFAIQKNGVEKMIVIVWNCFESNNEYKLRLTKTGIVFSTSFPHVIQACDEDVEITYRQLQPFLTQTGEAQVKYLIEGVLNAPNTDTSLK